MSQFSHMFSPYQIKNLRFKNRVLAAPVTTNRIALDGAPTAEGIDEYETRARGGFAQVTITETFVDFDYAARHEHGLDLVSPGLTTHHMESISILAEAIRAHGAVASIQLNHVGNVNHPDALGGRNPIGPSAMLRPDGVQIDEMDEEMIQQAADNYANACGQAKALGFDMVMLHGGHGWLLSQFTSPLSNKRTDRWGGSLEKRSRFARLVLDTIRKEVGEDFVIEYRVSGDERVEGGMKLEETAEFCSIINDKVDMIHVTSGMYHNHVESKAFSSMFDDHGCNLDLAAAIKAKVSVPVVSVGGYNDPELIDQVIGEGKCDFVAVGRQQFADPEFVNKALTGRSDEIAPCLRCSCFNPLASSKEARPVPKPWSCRVNPRASRELRTRMQPGPRSRKKVMVIGGGVSGMYAALTAAERGHEVVLAEKEASLGGILWMTEVDEHKDDLRRYKDSLITRLGRSGAEIRLETEVTAELIRAENPDAVVCAVGSELIVPNIPGIEKARPIWDVYRDFESLGDNIVVIGGGLIGSETGYWLGEQGKKVHIVEMLDDIIIEGNDSHRRALIPRMEKYTTWDVNTRCIEVSDDGARVADSEGKERLIKADTVIYAVGLKPKSTVVEELRGTVPWFVSTGDCVRARTVEEAVYEGFMAAMDIL